VVRATLQLMRAMVPANVALRGELQPDAGAVHADPALIGQIVLNLCTNALQAMRATGGRLEITLSGTPAINTETQGEWRTPDRCVRLTVEDTGHGMSEDVLSRIFEPFFTTRPVGEGTGLGLSVVHGIVQSLGGAISASSVPGKGSRFEILLPAVHTIAESGECQPR
jgi:signal transduction histidine kinase